MELSLRQTSHAKMSPNSHHVQRFEISTFFGINRTSSDVEALQCIQLNPGWDIAITPEIDFYAQQSTHGTIGVNL